MNTRDLLPSSTNRIAYELPGHERLLTPRQVGQWLGLSDRWVRDHATRRMPRIPSVKLGSLLRFRPADVEEFIATQLMQSARSFTRRQ
jgi:predicted DNA-binding transcriptional regulator AlpA